MPRSRAALAYMIAVGGVAGAALARWLLGGLLGAQAPLLVFTAPVFLAALYGGLGPGLVATFGGLVVGASLFVESPLRDAQELVRFSLFTLIGALASWSAERMRRAEQRAGRAEAALHDMQFLTHVELGRLSPDELLDALLDRVRQILAVDTACILVPSEEEQDMLEVRATKGMEASKERRVRVRVGHGFAGRIAATKEPVVLENVTPDQVENPVLVEVGIRSLLGVPLVMQGRVRGVLHVGTFHPRSFAEDDVRLLQLVGDRVALTLEYVRALQDERRLRELAEASSRAKDQFLATVSHELRTPLNVIMGWLPAIRSGDQDRALQARGLAAIERNIRVQARLIEDLLDVARANSGRLQLEVREVDLHPCVEAALEVVRPSAEAKQITISADLDPAAGPILGDPQRLQQIAWNLLANAIKFTPAGGRVHVQLRRVGIHAQLRVSDNGIGIPPEFVPAMFEAFSQREQGSTRRYDGLGLGLTIVKQLVEAHGARVHVESGGLDKGSTFYVDFPIPTLRQTPRPVPRGYERPWPRGWTASASSPWTTRSRPSMP